MAFPGQSELPSVRMTPETIFRVPVGVVSPLWALFGGAAVSGVAWWWMTRWTQPANLEALLGAMAPRAVEPTATVVELAEQSLPAEPVGGESAPLSPIVAAEPEPTPPAAEPPAPEPLVAAQPAPEAPNPAPVVEPPAPAPEAEIKAEAEPRSPAPRAKPKAEPPRPN